MSLSGKKCLSALIAAVVCTASFAQDGTGVQAGPFRVKPTIGLTVGHDNNVGQTNTDETSSFFWLISPGVRIDSGNEVRSFSLSYEIDAAQYRDSRIDDYDDHRLNVGAKFSPSIRNTLNLGAFYERGHDRRGTNSRQGAATNLAVPNSREIREIDEWDRRGADVMYTYGATGARGQLGLGAGISNLEYRNNLDYARFGDRDMDYLLGRFGWRLAPKTTAFIEAQRSNIDYDLQRRSLVFGLYELDSSERTLMVGLEFDATAKTSGRAGVGRVKKNFDDPRLADYSGTTWDVGMQYRIKSYSVLDFTFARGTQEAVNFLTLLDTDFSIERTAAIAWTHSWNDRLGTSIDLGKSRLDYISSNRAQREDDLDFWGVGADYRIRDWLSVGAGYKSYRRAADGTSVLGQLFDYDRDEISLTLEASL
jgi:polysaccharide biosynthesis protein VpsM